jgi:hypothetical protein
MCTSFRPIRRVRRSCYKRRVKLDHYRFSSIRASFERVSGNAHAGHGPNLRKPEDGPPPVLSVRFEAIAVHFEPITARFEPIPVHFEPIVVRFEAIAVHFEPIVVRFEAIAVRFEPIVVRFEAIAARFEPIVVRFERISAPFDRRTRGFRTLNSTHGTDVGSSGSAD